ncbi:uncharacterized protein LOC130998561 [Salvia miltiorrhiza]|uniref:uncharacterized protein LOC130998561 n=1 Tax=Salvia miltiorrhiza TaxID=226208 RepID=UPI0025AD458A|nr:uncharacterized protein LOC130998561 [Salvia miltiorrhiza]
MNCLVWNCRGLGNQPTVRQLVWLVKQKKPDLVFIMESKLFATDWTPVLLKLGFLNHFLVDCDCDGAGRKGGLGLLWSEELKVDIKSSSLHHILATVDNHLDPVWDFCGIYGWSRMEDHHLTWTLMTSLLVEVGERWLCGGDFNETLFHFEKKGGNMKPDARLNTFRSTVDACGLVDLGFVGDPYTWTNNQKGKDHILERLDRCFGNEAWMETFPGYMVSYLLRKSSDHRPLLLSVKSSGEEEKPHPRPFRFEAMWFKDERCKPLCSRLWEMGGRTDSAMDLHLKMEAMGVELKNWEKAEFSNIRKRCADLRKELDDLQKHFNDSDSKDQ